MNMKTETIDAVGRTGQLVTQSAAAFTGWAWLTSNEFYGFIGALVALGGLWITFYYKRKADRRMEEEHALRMKERQQRLDLMLATANPFAGIRGSTTDADTDLGKLEESRV